jgi:glycosyltransferase involved in cell wall biosynthesis
MKILYLAPFVSRTDHFDSGVVGYGATSGGAIVRELVRRGHTVDVTPRVPTATTKAGHAAQTYEELGRLDLKSYDCLFMYNTFHQFAAEVRRLMYESGATGTRLAAYTHGSHWDPSDIVRHDYPMLKFADLGNVFALDVVFLVSQYMLDVMCRTIEQELGPATAAAFRQRARVVGGTIDTERLDARRIDNAPSPSIIFNHSATPAKRPGMFFRVAAEVLADEPDVTVTVTRRFRQVDPGFTELRELRRRYPDRVFLGDTMPIDDYFTRLWQSHVQVSTATHESFGVSTVEAIYAGCCSLLPAAGCYPEIAGDAGIYAEADLAETLVRYVRDTTARERTAAAQRKAIQRFLPGAVAGRIEAALAGG